MKLRVIGCAGPYPGAGRPTSSYLLEAGGGLILLDMGSGALAELTKITDPAGLDAVCVSHMHWDHMCDLMPWQYLLEKRGVKMPVYFPIEEENSGRLDLFGPAVDKRFLTDECVVAGLRVTTVPTRHPMPNRAMRFTDGERVIVYTGDAADPDTLRPLCRDADILLADGAFLDKDYTPASPHMSARMAGLLAAECGVRQLVLTHLPPHTPDSVLLKEAQEAFRGTVLAEPGLCVTC